MSAKSDSKKGGSSSNEAYGEMGKMILLGVLSIIAWVIIFTLTLSATIAVMGDKLRDQGLSNWEIFKAKSWHVVGLLPFVLVIAFFVADYIPQNISIKNLINTSRGTETPKVEKDYRELVEEAKTKLESAEFDLKMEKYSLESYAEDNARLIREHRQAKTVKEKSELEERNKEIIEGYNKSESNIGSFTKEIPELKKKLKIARADLVAFRNGEATSFDKKANEALTNTSTETTNTNKEKFMLYGLLFLIGSLLVSYPMVYAIRSDRRELKLFNIAFRFLEGILRKVSGWGQTPFRFIIFLFYKGNQERPLNPGLVMQLGFERNSYLTDSNLNYHTQIIGGSGAGKTNLLKVMLEDRMAKGHSIIFFDFKADIELMDWMAGASDQYKRKNDLVILSMSEPKLSYAYNPIKHGSETEISSQIMNSLTWSEPFYKNKAEGALLVILKALCYQRDMGKGDFHLGDLYQFLNDPSFRMDIVASVSSLNYPEMYRGDLKRICEELTVPNKKENFSSLVTQISKILNSSAGDIVVHKIGHDAEFEFREVMETGKIAYLFMNSLKLKETASIMGKLMLQDLMKAVGQALLYCSKVDRHHVIMNIKKANQFDGRYERKPVQFQNKRPKIHQGTITSHENSSHPTDYI